MGLGETTLRSWCQIGNTQTLICTNPQTPNRPYVQMYQRRQNDKSAAVTAPTPLASRNALGPVDSQADCRRAATM